MIGNKFIILKANQTTLRHTEIIYLFLAQLLQSLKIFQNFHFEGKMKLSSYFRLTVLFIYAFAPLLMGASSLDGSGGCNSNSPNGVTYTLNVSMTGTGSGTVTSDPEGISCGSDCSEDYNQDTLVTLTALANTGSTFAGWSGACSGTGTCTVTLTEATSVQAEFTLDNTTLSVTFSGTGTGSVTSDPVGISCTTDCSHDFTADTPVTLTATPATGSTFAGWSGACTGTATCMVTMSEAKSVTAQFTLITYALTVTRAGIGNGTVTSIPSGISCGSTCSASYDSGTMVTLNATPDMISIFLGWSGGGCAGTGTCVVTMSAATSVTATFDAP